MIVSWTTEQVGCNWELIRQWRRDAGKRRDDWIYLMLIECCERATGVKGIPS